MPETRPVVGFVGLGRMGGPMSRNLRAAGYDVVVMNRTPAKAESLVAAGARLAGTVAEVASQVDVMCACLDRVETSIEVFTGPGGLAERGRPGSLGIDFSTIGPDDARAIGARLAARKIGFLDAPVSGGPEGATRATLAIMVGGSESDFERGRPVMQACGTTVVRMGELGAGSLTKLVNQLLCFVHGSVAAEAIGFAERVGLDLGALGQLMEVSFGQSKMFTRTLARVQANDLVAGAALKLYAKDLGLIDRVAATTGAPLPLTDAAHALLERARAEGLAELDLAGLIRLYR